MADFLILIIDKAGLNQFWQGFLIGAAIGWCVSFIYYCYKLRNQAPVFSKKLQCLLRNCQSCGGNTDIILNYKNKKLIYCDCPYLSKGRKCILTGKKCEIVKNA